ncbi:MAG: alcohol dehydrogenase catalytic domain-containing protein [Dehalococcoidia bacterium]
MKAGVLENIEHIVAREMPDPKLESGSVLIKVKVCSICVTDLRVYHHGHSRVKLPHILGHEVTGEVMAVAEGVKGYMAGDRVAVTPRIACGECPHCRKGQYIYCQNSLTFGFQLQGGYAEYLSIPQRAIEFGALIRISDALTFEEAAIAEPLSCCLRGQRLSSVSTGDTVVVIGGGPVGIMHCRLAKVNNAGKVILVERDLSRLKKVDLASIDQVIDSTKSDPKAKIASLTDGMGADVVIVACSSAQAQEQALSFAGKGGRINYFGGLPQGQSSICIDSNVLHYQEVSLQGTHSSTPLEHKEALDLLASGALKVSDLISHTFSLDRIQEAFIFAESNNGMHIAISP